jgi:Methylase involved in ubiquinone/menaquinone biosynthesis
VSADRETLAVYDARAEDYLARARAWKDEAQLARFLDGLAPGARLLDLGCGPGHVAAELRERGYDVLAIDPSPAMARIGREVFGVEIRETGVEGLPGTGPFDGVWASFSLLHAPRADFPGHLATLQAEMAPGGRLALGMKLGEGEARDRLGRRYAYYAEAELRSLLTTAGFTPEAEAITGADAGLAGEVEPWIVLFARA